MTIGRVSNLVCPFCKKGGFVYWIDGDKNYAAKCIGCHRMLSVRDYEDQLTPIKEQKNGDYIRSIKDNRELGQYLFFHISGGSCPPGERRKKKECEFEGTCIECWSDWLEKGADEE